MRTARRWRKQRRNLERKFGFTKFGKEVINSFVRRMIQGIFVGHHDRTRAILYIAKSGIVRGKSRTSQTLSGAWEPTNLEDGSFNPWPMLIRSHVVITEIKLTKKFTADEEEICEY